VFGEAADFVLRPDQVPVHFHVEDAAAAFDQFAVEIQLLFNRIRQTGGFGAIVSHSTVFDADRHGVTPS
jgi:hypothetical protein